MTGLRHTISPACGGCGSPHLLTASDADATYGVCLDCDRLQEIETRADPSGQLCDNCAFRPGSPERSDPWGWMRLEESFESGQPFYCHKGMDARLTASEAKLEYLPGEDLTKLQPCAGWIAWSKAHAPKNLGPRLPISTIGE